MALEHPTSPGDAPHVQSEEVAHDLLGHYFMASAGISMYPARRSAAPRAKRRRFWRRHRAVDDAA